MNIFKSPTGRVTIYLVSGIISIGLILYFNSIHVEFIDFIIPTVLVVLVHCSIVFSLISYGEQLKKRKLQ